VREAPKIVGERSEGQIIARFLSAGKVVLMPFGDSQRYDLVLDEGGSFVRVQCKTGRVVRGAVEFACCSNNWSTGERRDYRGQADVFAVYVPETKKMYMVSVQEVGIKVARLRLTPPRNGQKHGIRLAEHYEFKGP